jgi:hypothetical protein
VAQTTVSALSGQTVVLGGLITKSKATTHRRVPLLSSIPVLGHLFRYDQVLEKRTELMIIMTPHIVQHPADAEWLKQVESARMSWVLSDVHDLHGYVGLRSRQQCCADDNVPTIYPDYNPAGVIEGPTEHVPSPADVPQDQPGTVPPGVVPPDGESQPAPPMEANYFPGGRPSTGGPALRLSAPNDTAPPASSRSQSILRGEAAPPQAFTAPPGGPTEQVGYWQGPPPARPAPPLGPLSNQQPYPPPPPPPQGANTYDPRLYNDPRQQPVTQAGGATVMYGNTAPGQVGRPLDVYRQQYGAPPPGGP